MPLTGGPHVPKPLSFGRWTLNRATGTLDCPAVPYQIPLAELNNSAVILDWVFQIEEKSWATPDDVGQLVKAIVDIFGRHVCGSGVDYPFDA
jgi:hypothetical protein